MMMRRKETPRRRSILALGVKENRSKGTKGGFSGRRCFPPFPQTSSWTAGIDGMWTPPPPPITVLLVTPQVIWLFFVFLLSSQFSSSWLMFFFQAMLVTVVVVVLVPCRAALTAAKASFLSTQVRHNTPEAQHS